VGLADLFACYMSMHAKAAVLFWLKSEVAPNWGFGCWGKFRKLASMYMPMYRWQLMHGRRSGIYECMFKLDVASCRSSWRINAGPWRVSTQAL